MATSSLKEFKVGDTLAFYDKTGELCWCGRIVSAMETFHDFSDIYYIEMLVRNHRKVGVSFDHKIEAWRRDTMSKDCSPFDDNLFAKMMAIYKDAIDEMEALL